MRHPIGEVVLDLLHVSHDLPETVRVTTLPLGPAVAAQVGERDGPPFSARSEAIAL